MAQEIELKIRLDDPQAFRNRLAGFASFEADYVKNDLYFRGPTGSFRLRDDAGVFMVCRKDKKIEGGIEVSVETEFKVSSPAAFEDFAKSLGYQRWFQKVKKGKAWKWGTILVEEGEVSGIGWFAEFEILLDESSEASATNQAKQSLLRALTTLGVDHSAIEPRTYAQLLGQRQP